MNNDITQTSKAKVAIIDFGCYTVEGLELPDSSFSISASQCSKLFQLVQENASRDIKRILGKGFQFVQTTS